MFFYHISAYGGSHFYNKRADIEHDLKPCYSIYHVTQYIVERKMENEQYL